MTVAVADVNIADERQIGRIEAAVIFATGVITRNIFMFQNIELM